MARKLKSPRKFIAALSEALWDSSYKPGVGGKMQQRKAFLERVTRMGYDVGDSIQNNLLGINNVDDPSTQTRVNMDRFQRLSDAEIDWLYTNSKIARRGVEDVVQDAASPPPEKRAAFKALRSGTKEQLEDNFNITPLLIEAAINGRLTGTAAILLVTDSDQGTWTEPPREGEELTALIMFEGCEMEPYTFSEAMDDTFGAPLVWELTPNRPDGSFRTMYVHKDRLLLFHGEKLPRRLLNWRNGKHDSILQGAWGGLKNHYTIEHSVVRIVESFTLAKFAISGLQSILETDEGQSYLKKRLNLLQKTLSNMNAAVVDTEIGEDYTRQFASVNGLDTIMDRSFHIVAANFVEPVTKLWGMSPSGLATDDQSGRAQWRMHVNRYRAQQLTPLLRSYFAMLHGIEPSDVEIVWESLAEMTEKEQADVALTKAQTRATYSSALSVKPEAFEEQLREERIVSDQEELFEDRPDPMMVPMEPDDEDLALQSEEEE